MIPADADPQQISKVVPFGEPSSFATTTPNVASADETSGPGGTSSATNNPLTLPGAGDSSMSSSKTRETVSGTPPSNRFSYGEDDVDLYLNSLAKQLDSSQMMSVRRAIERQKQTFRADFKVFQEQVRQAVQRTQLLQADMSNLSELAVRTTDQQFLADLARETIDQERSAWELRESELLASHEEQRSQLQREVHELQDREHTLKKELQTLRQRLAAERADLEQRVFVLEDEARDERFRLQELKLQLTAKETELESLTTKWKATQAMLDSENQEIHQRLLELRASEQTLQEVIAQTKSELEKAVRETVDSKERYVLAQRTWNTRREALESRLKQLEHELAENQNNMARQSELEEALRTADEAKKQLDLEIEARKVVEASLTAKGTEIVHLQSSVDRLTGVVELLSVKNAKLLEQIETADNAVDEDKWTKSLSDLSRERDNLRAELAVATSQLEVARLSESKQTEDLEHLQAQVEKMTETAAATTGTVATAEEESSPPTTTTETERVVSDQIAVLEERLRKAEDEFTEKQDSCRRLQAAEEALQERLKVAEDALKEHMKSLTDILAEKELVEGRLKSAEQTLADKEITLEDNEGALRRAMDTITERSTVLHQTRQELKQAKASLAEYECELKRAKESLSELEKQHADREAELKEKHDSELRSVQEERDALREDLDAQKSKLEECEREMSEDITYLKAELDSKTLELAQAASDFDIKVHDLTKEVENQSRLSEIHMRELNSLRESLEEDFVRAVDELSDTSHQVVIDRQALSVADTLPPEFLNRRLKKTIIHLYSLIQSERGRGNVSREREAELEKRTIELEAQIRKVEAGWKQEYDFYLEALGRANTKANAAVADRDQHRMANDELREQVKTLTTEISSLQHKLEQNRDPKIDEMAQTIEALRKANARHEEAVAAAKQVQQVAAAISFQDDALLLSQRSSYTELRWRKRLVLVWLAGIICSCLMGAAYSSTSC